MEKTRILSLDPGTVNFGWGCLEYYRKRTTVVRCGMLPGLVKDLVKPLEVDVDIYTKGIRRMIRNSKATVLVSERYSTRIRGTTGEAVNMMIGIAVRDFLNMRPEGTVQVFMPMTWKASIKKHLGHEIPPFYKMCGIKAHPVDACLVGTYWTVKMQGGKWPNVNTFAKQINGGFIEL